MRLIFAFRLPPGLNMTDSPLPPAPSPTTTPAAVPSSRIVWLEVAVVFAIGVVPNFMASLTAVFLPPSAPWPYWLDSLNLIVLCGCSLLATLFIIQRSGEGWRKFGIVQLNGWDAALALTVLVVLEGLMRVIEPLGDRTSAQPYSGPKYPSEFAMMVVRYLVVGLSEEVVCRAYLITRFRQLFGNSIGAILITSYAFASYHIQYGLFGTFSVFLIGSCSELRSC
jgi:membrane protease YdiL (CAAX protease family)